jgi:hypothetical protein
MRRLGLALPLAGALSFGCGSDPVSSPPPGKQPAKATCEDPPGYADPTLPALDVGEVSATVLTPDGAPAVGALFEVCGINVCTSPRFTDADGSGAVFVEEPTQKPALKFGDALEFGELALLFDPTPGGQSDLGTVYTTVLPAEGVPIAPGAPAESAGVTLTLAANGTIEIDEATYQTEKSRQFRAAELPGEGLTPLLDHGAGLEHVFTLAPLGARLCPPAALSLPNAEGWAPGTAVEFLVQGFDVGDEPGNQPFAPYGEWQTFATGSVSTDGSTLVVTDGGLPVISNVGVRRP